jgi:hypothetical protein
LAAVVTPDNQLILIGDIIILETLIKGENQVLAFAAQPNMIIYDQSHVHINDGQYKKEPILPMNKSIFQVQLPHLKWRCNDSVDTPITPSLPSLFPAGQQ